jgi:hypothetical protein
MEHIGAPAESGDVEVPERPGIDWYLVATDSTAGCLFVAGLFALLVGLPVLGLGLWAACVWLDWRVLAYLRDAPADAVRLRQYVNRRVTTNGIAQVLAIALGLYLATGGHPWLAFGTWVVAAGGIVCSRMLSRVGTSLSSVPTAR